MTRTDKDGNTPFHLCCKNGHIAVVKEFLAIFDEEDVFEDANRSVQSLLTSLNSFH
jgi:ankyrin repeat protein